MDTPDFCVHCVTDCEAWVGMTRRYALTCPCRRNMRIK